MVGCIGISANHNFKNCMLEKARQCAGFFDCFLPNSIGLRGAGTLTAACQSFKVVHHFTH
jgi:hypothetical protein